MKVKEEFCIRLIQGNLIEFLIQSIYLIYLFSDLELGVSMILYVIVTKLSHNVIHWSHVTCHSHTIICHTEEHRRF